jgi:fumarate hydratase class I
MHALNLPIPDEVIRSLKVGDPVTLNGVMVTGRDAVHKWMIETFIRKTRPPQGDDLAVYEALKPILDGGVIYHCGPVVAGLESKAYKFVAAGPTTSIREEPYQAEVIKHFNLRGVIGKGGMGDKTLEACRQYGCVYLHAIGGAAQVLAECIKRVPNVYFMEKFGAPEAIWEFEVVRFPSVVTMDAQGNSLHKEVLAASQAELAKLI